jgi:Glucodextranase, domain B/FecR protein
MSQQAYIRTVSAAALTLAAGGALYLVIFRDDANLRALPVLPPAPTEERALPPAVSEPPAPAPKFVLAEIDGTVEVRRAGVWARVHAGDSLAEAEAIRTAPSARATLRSGSGDELVLRPRVELEVGVLGQTVTELTLTRGKVRAAPAPGNERFQITSGGARASAGGGTHFTVYADARGAVTVASENGDVKVLARDQQVTLKSREQTYVAPGAAPGAPSLIPDEVFVSVAWPAGELHAKSATLRGRAKPGTQITVNGEDAAVGPDGTFVAQVPLADGKNPVRVLAESMNGKKTERSGTLQADTKGPPLEADPNRLYDPKKSK